jgi:hypothetical protein
MRSSSTGVPGLVNGTPLFKRALADLGQPVIRPRRSKNRVRFSASPAPSNNNNNTQAGPSRFPRAYARRGTPYPSGSAEFLSYPS